MSKYLLLAALAASFVLAQQNADVPAKFENRISEEDYQRLRDDYLNMLRGQPTDPTMRENAIKMMEQQLETMQQSLRSGTTVPSGPPTWTAIGPSPIPNGQVIGALPVTGRVTAFAIDPTNTNIVYLGSAQGGVYRSKDGGANWTQIFDQANTSAIGALTLAPSNHTILYVGTGEANYSGDSFAGVGLYRIDNADTTAALVGPINPIRTYTDGGGVTRRNPAFQGRAISSIVVHPTDPSILWVGAVGGVIGIGGDAPFGGNLPPLGMRGLYRLTNATSVPSSVAVQKVAVTAAASGFDLPNTGNRNIDSIFMEPGNPDNLVVWINGTTTAGDGGIYRSVNATSAVPTFTQVLATTTTGARGIFSGYKQGTNPAVIYVADGESSTGRLRVSTDGGATWSAVLAGGRGFCGGQCFYNIGFDVLPGPTTATSDDILVLGGNTSGSSSRLFATSTNGGSTFAESSAGLHADTHFIRIDPTNRQVIYHGDDGGVFKTVDAGAHWTALNNMQINTVQFSGLAVHPIDPKWAIGGTQDNGTNMRDSSGVWRRVDFGDGGYALVDRNATDTTHITLYHTYFNQTNNLIGFGRVTSTVCAIDGEWVFKGVYGGTVDPTPYDCEGGSDTFNGIPLSDPVLFYAPMELGPGNPNSLYFGAGAVYRSADRGETMVAVSQGGSNAVSSIAVSPQDDKYRIFGRVDGTVFYTTTGSNPMIPLTGIPARYVGRVKFDPSNKDTAYVALGGYFGGTAATQSHVWKVTNLSTTATVTAINNGLPDVPVNAFAVDPANGANLFAGTDIGVYNSTDGGLTWTPYGTGLPVVTVFGMEIQAPSRTLRIATHGRGMWDISIGAGSITTGGPGASGFVTGYALNNPGLRNDFSGWVGMQFTNGAAPLTLTSLGRACIAGNGATHNVKLVKASDRTDVPGGAATVNMAGCTPGQFVYSPVSLTLPAGGSYYLVSGEVSGGDRWYNYSAVTTTGVATVNGAVYSTDGSNYVQVAAANNSYVPVSFQYASGVPTPQFVLTTNASPAGGGTIAASPAGGVYNAGAAVQLTATAAASCTFVNWSGALSGSANPQTVVMSSALTVTANFSCTPTPSSALITAFAATSASLRNDLSGFVGMNFMVGANALTVSSLGRVCVAGNSQTHMVKLVNATTNTDVAGSAVPVNMAGCTAGQFAYSPVSLTLPAGSSYYLVSQENSGGDRWYNYGGVTSTSAATVKGPVYSSAGTYTAVNAPNTSYVPVNLTYSLVTQTQYLLTSIISPAGGGSIAANPAGPSNYYNSGATVQLTAAPAAGCAFVGWSGALSGSVNPQSVTMNSALTVTANFQCSGQRSSLLAGYSQTSTLRNDFSNWVGMKFTVAASPLTTLSLGRACIAGNNGVHMVKLVRPDGSDVAGASVAVNMANCTPGTFVYSVLPSPLTLAARASYYLVSLESAGGDQWYDHGPVAATNAATVNGPVYFNGSSWTESNAPDTAYVPVSLQY